MWPFTTSYPEIKAHEVANQVFDYIIVGGGTAGCCLAARLSEDPHTSVLIIERGRVADTWTSRVPLLSANIYDKNALVAILKTEPVIGLNGRTLEAVIGEGLGGGSRINSGVYTRGIADYNKWKEMGHPDWGYDELEPLFAKSENALSKKASSFRGKTGPWINQTFNELPFKVQPHVYQATESVGFPHISDINSPDEPIVGCAALDITVDRSMHRHSTMRAFIPTDVAVKRKANLHVCVNTVVSRLGVAVVPGKTPRVTGVFFESVDVKQPRTLHASARKEVILCAGALANPQVLMLSGIGPKTHLAEFGIKLVKNLPGVGSYLRDHAGLPISYEVPMEDSVHVLINKPFKAMWELVKYLTTGQGLFTLPFLQTSIFARTSMLNEKSELVISDRSQLDARRPENIPDIEIMPTSLRASDGPVDDVLDKIGVFTFLTTIVQPKSHGSVRLRSADPLARPLVELGFLTNPEDIVTLRKGLRLALKLADQMRAQGYPLKDALVPVSTSDDDLDKYIREYLKTFYHYTSTCRMASEADIHPGVVDDELKVYGIDGLRVADTSIFPDIISTHTMAGATLVAEKCASIILKSK